ncbi:MAG: DUF5320 domain-containing protein, partial [Candidatus Aenigmarchaeota archaeon]|nr:DUF5320 domain-containing protein [Candidatus Aenigmarchaeota archaeon]
PRNPRAIGRGTGPCGRGFARGMGWGQGFFCQRPRYLTKEEEKELIKEDLELLEREKKALEERLKELK